MNKKLIKYLEQFERREYVLAFLITIKEELKWDIKIDDEDLFKLIKDRIVSRDYVKREFIVLVPIYNHEDEINHIINEYQSIDEKIDEYRILFKGPRVGNMGNKKSCIDLMNKFMIEHLDVDFNLILNASLYYIQNTEYQYIMGAENFIYKIDDSGRQISKLETVIEEYLLSNKDSNLL